MDRDFGIIKLEYIVKILYIPDNLEKSMLFSILKVLINNKSRFITYTKTDNETSLIIDNNSLEDFSGEELALINIDSYDYSILQIFEDCAGTDQVGIVAGISKIFADNQIPILYINSYNNNYILYPTTFKTQIDTLITGLE